MKVLVLSGIFARSPEWRATHLAETPDSLLVDGLRAAGVDVTAAGPSFRGDWSEYDVVHLNHLTNACLRASLPNHGTRGRTKVVFTPHTSGWQPWRFRVARNLIERRADRVVVFTEDQRERLDGRVPDRKVEIIRSGLAVDRFTASRRSRPAPGEPIRLLYIGQLIECKRVHLALHLLHRVIAAGRPARLSIVSHRETLRPELEELAEALGVSDHVDYLGTRTRDEIGPEMATSHFLVLPSYREALSTVTSEAAICGLPTLLFDVSGSEVQVPPGWERPEPDDVERFLRLALERIERYEECEEAWARNADVVRERLSVDRMVERHIELYERLVRDDTAPRASAPRARDPRSVDA
ncbi:glycosyltransferase family 4 protein [Curtobacterium sp. UCD-KPL2560]|uniref:glycosyltransferase family 4 protein n=1 Tax=Curtobacterium sp. UCD-KPL2560 TaxID=1885315 RepID=UPI000825E048|nr:glycosyltransferase family 4 protein [Curtobacterium sp. UCD-KPL2560]